jgi:hypothetical protein
MLKMRLGAVPETEVNTPHPLSHLEQPTEPGEVFQSCHSAKIVKSYGHAAGGAGRQLVVQQPGSLLHAKLSRPVALTVTALKVWSYNTNGNGKVISVPQFTQ